MDITLQVKKIQEKDLVLVITDAQEIAEFDKELLGSLSKQDYHGVVVAFAQSYEKIVESLDKDAVQSMFFIDCISKEISQKGEQHLFIENPANLTEIGIAITEALKSLPDGKKFLFIDSISTIAMYVSKNTFAKFSHFLASKIRAHGAMGIFMGGTKNMDEEIKQSLTQFCDRVIDLTEGDG